MFETPLFYKFNSFGFLFGWSITITITLAGYAPSCRPPALYLYFEIISAQRVAMLAMGLATVKISTWLMMTYMPFVHLSFRASPARPADGPVFSHDDAEIVPAQRMTVFAMSFLLIQGGWPARIFDHVCTVRYGTKMIRINAVLHPADVVKLFASWNRSFTEEIRKLMCSPFLKYSITSRVDASSPYPASSQFRTIQGYRSFSIDLRKEKVGARIVSGHVGSSTESILSRATEARERFCGSLNPSTKLAINQSFQEAT
jgi:hypothetical protein